MLSMLVTALSSLTDRIAGLRRDHGLETVEYALIAALIAIVVIATVTALGGQIQTVFNNILTAMGGAAVTN